MMKKIVVEVIATTQEFKVQLTKPFLACIFIMITEKIYLLFENSPPIIKNGDTIYHIIADILSILSQLAVSVAAAIIFYYCIEFINKKKDMEKYIELRRNLLILIYLFMELLSNCKGFECIKLDNLNKRMNDVNDIEPFIFSLNNMLTKERKDDFICDFSHFIQLNRDSFEGYLRVFESDSIKLKNEASSYRYIKNSQENMEQIYNSFEDIDNYYMSYKNPINDDNFKTDLDLALRNTVTSFIDFISLVTAFEVDINSFMMAINRKKIITFMKLLD